MHTWTSSKLPQANEPVLVTFLRLQMTDAVVVIAVIATDRVVLGSAVVVGAMADEQWTRSPLQVPTEVSVVTGH